MKTITNNPTRSIALCVLNTATIIYCLFLLAYSLRDTAGYFIILFLAGWLSWTFVEYFVHRFLMHELIVPGNKENLFNHYEHHQNPKNLKVSFFNRSVIFIVGVGLIWIAWELNNLFTLFAGFFTGFITYNFIHFILHQPYGKYILPRIQEAHILHHTRYPNCGYSFSTILWDWMYDTLPPKRAQVTEQMRINYFKNSTLKKSLVVLLCLVQFILFQQCVPVFSDLQSARTVGKGNVELTPFYSRTASVQSHFGINGAVGVSPTIDLRARFEHVFAFDDSDDLNSGVSVLAIGPKFGIIPNRIAFSLPIGTSFGEYASDNFQIHPTLLLTQPLVQDKFEMTLAPKYLIPFCENCTGNFAANLGLAYSRDLDLWAIRAEYGRLFYPDGGFGQFSLGFSFNILNKKRAFSI